MWFGIIGIVLFLLIVVVLIESWGGFLEGSLVSGFILLIAIFVVSNYIINDGGKMIAKMMHRMKDRANKKK